ncbi:hypothetical protein LDENG_00042900 [Lucifuga dentata]|nr:hypothetical protein LDENG_00042900 [Lucifuga dentata]
MDDSLVRKEAAHPRRTASMEVEANVSPRDGEVSEFQHAKESQAASDRPCGRTERRNSANAVVHQRHMPMEPHKFHIPRKNKEKRDLFQPISAESREYEDMLNILTSSYIDTGSAGCFTYSKPRLIHSELLEKEFVEKRKAMKADGRTDKELEESHCFLMTDAGKLRDICEKGLFVGQSRITALGNPSKGVYLSKYSDLLQMNPCSPGATGELIIFKVMKGKVKSIYENMSKNLLDPTPRFDSHISKNASQVTSLTSYRAFELTQQYFYEYSFDELRQRPRQICPCTVVSFHFKGKDSLLPSKPLAPVRLNSQSAEGSQERAHLTVWTGELVKDYQVLFQVSLCSSSRLFLPHKLPERLELGWLMRLERVTRLLPSALFSWSLYNSNHEVVKNGHYCSLLEVVDRSRTGTGVTRLLQELEIKKAALVTPLTERGFLFLLSSVQMTTLTERQEGWKRCLQALFVFPKSRDLAKSISRCNSSSHNASESLRSGHRVMSCLNHFLPALHHALVKARANPTTELSASVERHARDYLSGLNDGTVLQYPMSEYDTKLDERDKLFSAPKLHRANMDSYLRSYLYSPTLYLLAVAKAKQMVEVHCGPEELQDRKPRRSWGEQMEGRGKEPKEANTQKVQELINFILNCKRNAEKEMNREEGVKGGHKAQGKKRRMEQEMAQRTLKYLKASQAPERHDRVPVEGGQDLASPTSFTSLIGSVSLKDGDLSEEGSALATRLLNLLTGLNQAARGTANRSLSEEGKSESWPFDRLATKLGLPTNCDIDLRKQEELEEQTAGSVSSLEGFSPSSHSGEINHHGAGERGGEGFGRSMGGDDEENDEGEIPWVLIPITGLRSERYTQRHRDIPQDPRFLHLTMATDTTVMPNPSPQPNELSPRKSHVSKEQLAPAASRESAGVTRDSTGKPQLEEKNKELPSLPSIHQDPERRRHPAIPETQEQRTEDAEEEMRELQEVKEEENWSDEGKEAAMGMEDENVVEVHLKDTAVRDEEQNGEAMEVVGSSSSLPPLSSPSVLPLRDVDSIMKRHLHSFSSEIQQLLQEEGVHFSFPQSPHDPTSCTQTAAPTDTLPQIQLAPFSQYVSFYSPCPQVQNYVSSLKDSIDSILVEVANNWQSCKPDARQTDVDVALANRVSAYVASIRAANADVSRDHEDSAVSGELAASGIGVLANRPNITRRLPDAASRNPPAPPSLGFTSTSLRLPSYELSADRLEGSSLHGSIFPSASTNNPVLPPSFPGSYNQSQQSEWKSQQNNGAIAHGTRKTQDSSCTEASHCAAGITDRSLTHTDCTATLPEFGGILQHLAEPSQPADREGVLAEPVSCPASVSVPGFSTGPAPPPATLSSLISQLQPEVFSNLEEIIKDVKRNSLQFYIPSTLPEDHVYNDVREYLLKQGNVEQSSVDFLNQENSDNRLLVIIKNQDIAGHIHKIPGLVSLKRHPSVMFVGIDTLDDIRNNSYNELFVSGGCIVSDEFILNPEFVKHEQVAALLKFLEQQSSAESVWRWKVHCKTHKKLKEQASCRLKRDAAKLLDILSAYQKRLIVEFLPYHHCDRMNCQSPDQDCLLELQARYTQYRHTIFLTELRFQIFPKYSTGGIVVANIEEILHNFTGLVGYHDVKYKQPIKDDLLAPKGQSW